MLSRVVQIRQTKVDDLDVPRLRDQDVFDFQVCPWSQPVSAMPPDNRLTGTPTPMDDVVLVAVIQRTPDLPCKLACHALPQPPVTDDVVQHLPPVDVLEHHVVVVRVHDHLPHPADVRMVQQHRQRRLPQRADLF